jgi:hypothetical protein
MARNKLVNGAVVPMTAQEEADFLASLVPSLVQAKAEKRQAIIREWEGRESKAVVFDYAGNMNSYLAQTLTNARTLKASLDAATTLEQVAAIDEKGGWP